MYSPLDTLFETAAGRKNFLKLINDENLTKKSLDYDNDNSHYDAKGNIKHGHMIWQTTDTPDEIIEKMVNKVDDITNKNILVMFNLEFVEHLIYIEGVSEKKITFIADDELKEKMGWWYGVNTIKLDSGNDIKLIDEVKKMAKQIKKDNLEIDTLFSNPPYNGSIDIKILKELITPETKKGQSPKSPLAKELVVVHPSTWLMDVENGSTNLFNEFRTSVNGKLKSIDLFNGNNIFDIDIFSPISITHIDTEHTGECNVRMFSDEFIVNDVFDITKFGNHWKTIVTKFFGNIGEWCSLNSSIWDNFKDNKTNNFIEDKNKFCFQLPMGRGNSLKNNKTKMINDDFYTFFSNDINEVTTKNMSAEKSFGGGTYLFFDTEIERDNFIDYLKTDFARFCLSLLKINKHIDNSKMSMTPMMDFTQEWNDEKLYEFFNIDEETQDYITNFLPDYHNIRGEKND